MKAILLIVLACVGLVGCFASCAVGDPLALFTYCPKEANEALLHPKPYGAHWVKEGMTRESRLFDLMACGALDIKVREFPQDQIIREKKPNEPNDVAASLRLRDKVGVCMQGKGYTPVGHLEFLWGCDARCLYP